ncbi:MAG TPA: iron chelate uptake ABC transporter family permease subunit [Blastocatellia bacterium]|nr:iron chelate uptake ABC transporter family permease subunit [Blastocatellia bacterium]
MKLEALTGQHLTPPLVTVAGSYLTRRRAAIVLLALGLTLGFCSMFALAVGSEHIDAWQILLAILAKLTGAVSDLSQEQEVIVFSLRLPRIGLAIGVGAALAMAGAAFQALLRNPLADPYVLGVSGGAAVGSILAIMVFANLAFAQPVFSFAGAMAATLIVYQLGRRDDDPARMALAGVVLSTFLASMIALLTSVASNVKLRQITLWLLGDLSSGSYEGLVFVIIAVAFCLLALMTQTRALNLMMIGERDAFALGVETSRVRWVVHVTASLVTGAAVAAGGAIGYVGLVVPHLVRLAVGADNRLVLPASALAGSLLVLLADTAARTLIAPRELPTGAITALVGAPVFIYLLVRSRKQMLFPTKLHDEETKKQSEVVGSLCDSSSDFVDEHSPENYGGTLAIHDVQFGYHHRAVISGVSLEIRAGEVVALLGPNGTGKSTLLGLAYGALQPTSGDVTVDGQPVRSFSRRELAHRIAIVAQSAEVRFPLTALEYVLTGRFAYASAIGFDAPGDVELAMQALADTDAAQFAHRYFNELSSGERQRVVLARALAQQATLLLLDEPTANADIAHQVSLLHLIRALTRQRRLGALVVTHEINLAAEFADRVALLKGGQLLACGTPSEVMTGELLGELFGTSLLVDAHPVSGNPRVSWTVK